MDTARPLPRPKDAAAQMLRGNYPEIRPKARISGRHWPSGRLPGRPREPGAAARATIKALVTRPAGGAGQASAPPDRAQTTGRKSVFLASEAKKKPIWEKSVTYRSGTPRAWTLEVPDRRDGASTRPVRRFAGSWRFFKGWKGLRAGDPGVRRLTPPLSGEKMTLLTIGNHRETSHPRP